MRLLVVLPLILAITTPALAQDVLPLDGNRETVHFTSGRFQLDGDLITPRDGTAQHPAIVYVWGSGPTNRHKHIDRSPVLRAFLAQGYAVLLYDKPGSGGSTGEINSTHQFSELSTILIDAMKWLATRSEINARAIGLYGSSQASYVMAATFARTKDVAFVIAWSCPMQSSIDQGAYLVRNYVLCDGGSAAVAGTAATAYGGRARARTYAEYLTAAQTLDGNASIRDGLGWAGVKAEDEFTPADSTSESFFDPSVAFAALEIPLLALYAENDKQIDPAQGARFLQGKKLPLATVATIPGADHNMNLSPRGCMQDQRDDYKSVGGRTISPMFVDTINRWLEALRVSLPK